MYNQMKLNSYEKLIVRSSLNKVQSSLLAGISRKTRLEYDLGSPDIVAVRELSSGVIAPVIFLYVWWVLIAAKKKKIDRIYFLARDGQIFKEVADILNNEWELNLDLRYFFSSRESLLPPSFTGNNHFDQKWLFSSIYGNICLREICARVSLDVCELESVLSRFGLSKYCFAPDTPLSPADLSTLKKTIYNDEFCSIVKNAVKEKTVSTTEYLNHIGMVDGIPFAVVDSGWSGSSQYALKKLLENVGCSTPIIGFYVGVNMDIYSYPEDELHGFLFDWRKSPKNELLANFLCYEVLFSGTHGRTVGYEDSNGCISPLLLDKCNGKQAELVAVQHECAKRYAHDLCKNISYETFSQRESIALCTELVDSFISKPSVIVATTYGEFEIGGEIGERDYQLLAPPVSVKLFLDYVFGKKKVKGLWFQASFVRSGNKMMLSIYNIVLRSKLICFYRKILR